MEDIENSLIKESTEAIIPYENINELNPTISLTDGEMGNATSALVFFRTVKGSDLNTKAKDALSYLKDCWWIYNRVYSRKYSSCHTISFTSTQKHLPDQQKSTSTASVWSYFSLSPVSSSYSWQYSTTST